MQTGVEWKNHFMPLFNIRYLPEGKSVEILFLFSCCSGFVKIPFNLPDSVLGKFHIIRLCPGGRRVRMLTFPPRSRQIPGPIG